jgi:hypothetical protein
MRCRAVSHPRERAKSGSYPTWTLPLYLSCFRIEQPHARPRMVRLGPRVKHLEPPRLRFCPCVGHNLRHPRSALDFVGICPANDQRLDQVFPCWGNVAPPSFPPLPKYGAHFERRLLTTGKVDESPFPGRTRGVIQDARFPHVVYRDSGVKRYFIF